MKRRKEYRDDSKKSFGRIIKRQGCFCQVPIEQLEEQ
jgi:hypothetical protein